MFDDPGMILILIHPPLAVLGYIFSFIAAKNMGRLIFIENDSKITRKDLKISLLIAFLLTFAGLATGMIWARFAWGRFWSWDPKETATLAIFISLSLVCIMNLRKVDIKVQGFFLLINILFIIGTVSISFIDIGLHSFFH